MLEDAGRCWGRETGDHPGVIIVTAAAAPHHNQIDTR